MHTAPRPPWTKRLRMRYWVALDAVVALLLTAVTWQRVMDAYRVFDPHGRGYARPTHAQVATVLACVVVVGVAMAARRWRPVVCGAVVFAAWSVIVAVAGQLTIANLAGFQVTVAGAAVGGGDAQGSAERTARDRLLAAITEREAEILVLIAQGLTNTEIAGRLVISTGTVKTHVGHLLAKLGARDRVHLVILAYQAGLAR